MTHPYEVLFDLSYDSSGQLVGVPHDPNHNKDWANGKFVFDKKGKMHRHDPHLVRFTLVTDNTGDNLRFPSDPRNAMWVEKGTNCPTRTSRHDYSVIEPLLVLEDGRTLIALNKNEKKQDWGITLNFLPSGETDPMKSIPWDPPGDNQNNGYGFYSNVNSETAVTLAVAGAVATAIYFGMESQALVDDMGAGLLISLTLGFAIAALVFRFLPQR